MIPWSAFFDMLSPEVPGCPQAAQVNALRQSAIAFCEQSMVWKYDHPDIAVVIGTAKYIFDPPEDAMAHAITWAEFNGTQLETRPMVADVNTWSSKRQTGKPEFVLGGPVSLTLVPTPDIEGTLKLTVVLKPSQGADGIDDNIFNEYREAICHGAMAKLMLSPKKPYTDAVMANYHDQMFRIKTGHASVRSARNYTRAPLQTSIMKRRDR